MFKLNEKWVSSPKIFEMGKSVDIFINPSPSEIRQIPTMQDEYKFARFIINDKHDVFVFDGDAMHGWLYEFIPSKSIAEGTIDYTEHVVDGYGSNGILEVKSNVWFQLYYKGWELPRGRGFIESKLTELFDNPVPWQSDTLNSGVYVADFQVEGLDYSFFAEDRGTDMWEITFEVVSGSASAPIESKWGITGSGNQFTVFATIADILFSFIGDYEPRSFYFNADEPSRRRLYAHFSKTIEKQIPYSLDISNGVSEFTRNN